MIKKLVFWLFFLLVSCAYTYFSYFLERKNFIELILLVSLLFTFYLYIVKYVDFVNKTKFLLFFTLIPVFSFPTLSNDYFRFLWDGELFSFGINPFDYKPNELIQLSQFNSVYFKELHAGMGDLSQNNYSCYPVLNQFYFFVSTLCSNNILINTIVLRVLIVLSLILGYFYTRKLSQDKSLGYINLEWLFWNPLLHIELIQNLHFEGVMLTFFIIGIYYINHFRLFWGACFFTAAIQIKLIPLMFLPFFLRKLNWKKTIILFVYVIVLLCFSSLLLITKSNYLNYLSSLKLYFQLFEFNSFFLHYYIEYGKQMFGYNRIQTYGPYLSRIAISFLIVFAWLGNNFTLKIMLERMFLAAMIYYFCSSTIHPWYLSVPLVLGVFAGYYSILVWSLLIFVSYYFYSDFNQSNWRTFVFIEYSIVFPLFLGEMILKLIFQTKKT